MPYKDPEKRAEAVRKSNEKYKDVYKQKYTETRRAYARKRTADKKNRGYHLKKSYGITEIQWDCMFEQQGRRCKICKTEETSRWCTDHCHRTGRVRGILCDLCNKGLGCFRDNTVFLNSAISYLTAQ